MPSSIEREMNEMASNGRVLKSNSVSHEGEDNNVENHFAVIERELTGK